MEPIRKLKDFSPKGEDLTPEGEDLTPEGEDLTPEGEVLTETLMDCPVLTDTLLKIDDIEGIINSVSSDVFLLGNSDFTEPLIITNPGTYKLTENIQINFYPNNFSIFDIERTGNDIMGFSSAIKILSDNVILDLNGYTLYQSPQDFCVKKNFNLIQLNNTPLDIDDGLFTDDSETFTSTSYCIVKNGVLGLTSGNAISGKKNENIVIKDINIQDFEENGIYLRGVKKSYLYNINVKETIGINRRLSLNHSFTSLISNYRILKIIFYKFKLSSFQQLSILTTNMHILNYLQPILYIIYTNSSLTKIYDEITNLSNLYTNLSFMFNGDKYSNTSVHGIKIVGLNEDPFFNHFLSDADKSEDITIEKINISRIFNKTSQEIIFTKSGKPVKIGAELLFNATLIQYELIQILIKNIIDLNNIPEVKKYLQSDVDNSC